jgi:hypothetical protein
LLAENSTDSTSDIKFVTEDEDVDEMQTNLFRLYVDLKKYSKKYRKEVEEKINSINKSKEKKVIISEEKENDISMEKSNNVNVEMNNSFQDLDVIIVEDQKDLDTISKLQKIIKKLKLFFNNILEKIIK